MPRYAYVNGAYVRHQDAVVHIEDRGFQFADSVYEMIACINGTLADEKGHLDRLEYSLKELSIVMPVSRDSMRFIIREMIRRNRMRNAAIYIQVTRGVATRDFAFPAQDVPPTLVMTIRPFQFDRHSKIDTGVDVITVPDIRWKRRDIKSNGLLAQVLARQSALDQGAYDAWMVDDKGYVTEGSASNAWIVTADGKLVTRQATQAILRGITRMALMELCKDLGIILEERSFTVEEAYNAKEAFATGAVALIVPVITLDGHKIGDGKPGDVARQLYSAYRAYVKSSGAGSRR